MSSLDRLFGVRVMVNDLAVSVRRMPVIERCRVPKRRRGWTLRYVTEQKPCAYRLANGDVVMHSAIHRKMLAEMEARVFRQ